MTHGTILLAEDEATLRENLAQVLEESGYGVVRCRDGSEALQAVNSESIDAIITDLRMPGVSGLDLIRKANELSPETPIIVITAFGEIETAVEAMKRGAREYICKPLNFNEVVLKLNHHLHHRSLVRENKILKKQLGGNHRLETIVAESAAMKAVVATIRQVAHTMSSVLLTGESGTGKEVVARALHSSGVTSARPFVPVNCGGLTGTLLESQLFGYRKGAFTGAAADRPGYFETANGGTLFLDEVGNLPLPGQAALLRAIEEKAVTRVGDTRSRRIDLRIVAATNRDLDKDVAEGRFREDLFYRLNVIRAELPPLRERPEDVPPLVERIVRKLNRELGAACPGVTDAAAAALRAHPWPGNVRELENAIERALIFAGDKPISMDHLPITVASAGRRADEPDDLRAATRAFERQYIVRTLAHHDGNKAEAAKALGIGLSSLYRKIDELGIGKAHGVAAGEQPSTSSE